MGVHAFLNGISPKLNVIALLDFILAHCDLAEQHFTVTISRRVT